MTTDNISIKLNGLINAVNELDKIYIVTGIETPDNVLKQLGDIKAYAMELLGGYYELTENYNAQTAVIGFFEADNKQKEG